MSRNSEVAGLSLTILMIALITYGIAQYGTYYPSPSYNPKQIAGTAEGSDLIVAMGGFLWDYRTLDLLDQTLILFATAAGCTALIRMVKSEK